MTILLASTAGATMLLGIALIAGVALRRASAAQRHAVLAAAVLVALAAPALELLVPQLPVIRWHDPRPALSSGLTLTSGDDIALSEAATSPATREGISWPALLLSIWALGAMVTCAGLITSLLRLARLTARCTPVREGRWRQMTDALSHALGIRHHVETGVQHTIVTDPSGRFAFRDLLPGRYALVASLPGFASVNQAVALDWGDSIHRTITLPLGTLEETITVVCGSSLADARSIAARARAFVARAASGMFPVVMVQGQVPMPVRVGGNVRPPTKANDVFPVCPPGVVPATEISVRLAGRVGADGLMHDVTHLVAPPGMEPPTELTQAALDAVRQWTFTPTLLNGRAVDVNIAVHVLFRRE
jgi:hypothetical protein